MIVPYPVIRGDYWANAGFWWDLEFWNRSVDREAAHPNQFSGTPPGSFPKIDPHFDPETGLANFDVDSYVAQAATDARFHIEGRFLTTQRGVSIVFPDRPWRADWVTYGLYPDGWTRPGTPARIRVFPDREPGGAGAANAARDDLRAREPATAGHAQLEHGDVEARQRRIRRARCRQPCASPRTVRRMCG